MTEKTDYTYSFYLVVIIILLMTLVLLSVTSVFRLKGIKASLEDIELQTYQIRQAVQIFNARLWHEVDDTVNFAIPRSEDQTEKRSEQ